MSARPGPDFILEHLLAPVEGLQGCGRVAEEVVEPDDPPVSRLGQGLAPQQAERDGERRLRVAGLFQGLRLRAKAVLLLGLPLLPLAPQPSVEFRRFGQLEVAK